MPRKSIKRSRRRRPTQRARSPPVRERRDTAGALQALGEVFALRAEILRAPSPARLLEPRASRSRPRTPQPRPRTQRPSRWCPRSCWRPPHRRQHRRSDPRALCPGSDASMTSTLTFGTSSSAATEQPRPTAAPMTSANVFRNTPTVWRRIPEHDSKSRNLRRHLGAKPRARAACDSPWKGRPARSQATKNDRRCKFTAIETTSSTLASTPPANNAPAPETAAVPTCATHSYGPPECPMQWGHNCLSGNGCGHVAELHAELTRYSSGGYRACSGACRVGLVL